MKKYRCPHCGEYAFGFFKKIISQRYSVGQWVRDALYFTCNRCGKPIEQKPTVVAQKFYSWAIPFILISAVVFLILSILHLFVFLFVAVGISALLSFAFSYVMYKHNVIIRENGSYNPKDDVYVSAKIKVDGHINTAVFELKPEENELYKTSVSREYIVELNDYDSQKETCNMRIIKPLDVTIPEDMHFNIVDNDKIIGTGYTLILTRDK